MKRKIFTSLLAVVIACTAMFALPMGIAAESEVVVPTYADGNELFETQMFLGAWCEPEGTEQLRYFTGAEKINQHQHKSERTRDEAPLG